MPGAGWRHRGARGSGCECVGRGGFLARRCPPVLAPRSALKPDRRRRGPGFNPIAKPVTITSCTGLYMACRLLLQCREAWALVQAFGGTDVEHFLFGPANLRQSRRGLGFAPGPGIAGQISPLCSPSDRDRRVDDWLPKPGPNHEPRCQHPANLGRDEGTCFGVGGQSRCSPIVIDCRSIYG